MRPAGVRVETLSDGAGARGDTHGRAGRSQVLQHVGDGDLQQGLSEELLAHRAAVIVVFLRSGGRKTLRGKSRFSESRSKREMNLYENQ